MTELTEDDIIVALDTTIDFDNRVLVQTSEIRDKILQAIQLEKAVRELLNNFHNWNDLALCADREEHYLWAQKLQQLLGDKT